MSKKKVVLISASPRPKKDATSTYLSNMQADILKSDSIEVIDINVRTSIAKKKEADDYEVMLGADAFIITFPLYVFCLPGILMRYLQGYYKYWRDNKDRCNIPKKVYSVINCGFPEADINEEAARVIKSFSEKIESSYRFSVLIGGGGMLVGSKEAPFIQKMFDEIEDSYKKMASDIVSSNDSVMEDKHLPLNFPRKIYLFFGSRNWFKGGKKNGVKRKDMYKRPYLSD